MVNPVFSKAYSPKALINKISLLPDSVNTKIIEATVTLFIILQEPTVPLLLKSTIVTAIGYFIMPVDLVPDFLPGGFLDDIAIIMATLAQATAYQNSAVDLKVKDVLTDWNIN